MRKTPRALRATASFLLIQFTLQTFLPSISYALTSGPAQPEFSSFEPVSSSNMVDEFSGDFMYNLPVIEVPGPNGSGYPISLSYHSGVTPEEESSWVGLGWTLNAGAINRSTRGLPDDFNGKNIVYDNKMPANWTATTGASVTCCEAFSVDLKLGINASLRYNNYRGFGYNVGAGMYLGRGVVALGYNVDNGEGSFSLDLNPTQALNNYFEDHKVTFEKLAEMKMVDERGKKFTVRQKVKTNVMVANSSNIGLAGSKYGIFSFNEYAKPASVSKYSGSSYNIAFGLQENVAPLPVGTKGSLYASFTTQSNLGSDNLKGYGYLYNANATSGDAMDYHVEKETDYNKRDVFLGVPFNDADNFNVSGEGIGGGFRLYNKKIGSFGPRSISSGVTIYNVGFDVDLGWTLGPGVNLGLGSQESIMGDWGNRSPFAGPKNSINNVDEPVFFRFYNDMGGELGSNFDDKPMQASLSGNIVTGYSPVMNLGNSLYNNGERSGRSSYIDYNTNSDMLSSAGTPSYKAYNKNSYLNSYIGRTAQNVDTDDLIGEMAVVNESGTRYLYSLPVYNRNEENLGFSVEDASGSDIENNYLVYNANTDNNKVKVGFEQPSQYASTYLLTEITTPDYIDRTSNGATSDDLGGYTRFNYTKNDGWFNWRSPYYGLHYSKNSHSDPKDDQGVYTAGEKEIYYLQSIETKTHVAIFVTSDRADGLEASLTPLVKNAAPGPMRLKKLDRIELYLLADCQRDPLNNYTMSAKTGSKPVKTVYFTYANDGTTQLCVNQPNSVSSNSGKLTLQQVYFEYNGVHEARISPYQFFYSYPSYNAYPAKYAAGGVDDVTVNYSSLSSALQNPNYSEFSSDAWGNYQANGDCQFKNMRTWIDQKASPNITFDPAPWHLKRIVLPSGGEVHVQYEQDDYAYVQDQEAHIMVPLASDPGISNSIAVNASAVGITDLNTMADMINTRYAGNKSKMYFKFLYTLIGTATPDLKTCNAEFVDGYVSIVNAEVEGGQLHINLSGRLPQSVCQEFANTQRLGLIDPLGNCTPGMNEATSGTERDKAVAIVRELQGMIDGIVTPGLVCTTLSPQNSYLRLPTPNPKKGGGVRVKRIMTFANNSNLGKASALYGNEYTYQTTDASGRVISSGVATNEPQAIREENILVGFIARKNQSLWSKIIAGKDRKQSEGPIGESVLPAPSVGYSKVIIKNIHSGKTNPGYSISEYYTAKDFPITLGDPDKSNTMTGIMSATPDKKMVFGVLVNIFIDRTWVTQGFSFTLNNMHGQMKSVSTFSGPPSDALVLSKSSLVSRVTHEYFAPGEKVPVVSSLFGDISLANPGREVDFSFATKQVEEKSYDANVQADIEFSFVPPFITLFYPTAMPSASYTEGGLHTHATTKVVHYPAILKKTTIYQDGILHTEENVAFDKYTGRPVAVKSLDEFKGAYLAASIPAGWQYPNYTPKATTEGLVLKPSSSSFVFTPGSTPQLQFTNDGCSVFAKIVTGDVLQVGTDPNALYQIQRIDYTQSLVDLAAVSGYTGSVPAAVTSVIIVHSGRTNELTESAGDITFHNPVADNINAGSMREPDSQRFISSGSDSHDGSLFINDLNCAFKKKTNLLPGPYYHMNLLQYGPELPADCTADLGDATVRNVNMLFKSNGSSTTVELGTFEILCNGGAWMLVKMPSPSGN